MIAMLIATQPKPARKPAVAPHARVVLASLRNMAKLNAITRLKTKLRTNTFAPAGGGSLVNPLARFHAPLKSAEYQTPPTRNADSAATRIAQIFNVLMFIAWLLSCPRSSFSSNQWVHPQIA